MHTIENDFLRLAIEPLGAEMKSLQSLANQKEWLWNADPEYWPRTAPVLFPIVGRLAENQYTHEGKIYPLSQHGFARDRVFSVARQESDKVRMVLESDYESRKFYPFDFLLAISYNLAKNWVWIDYEVVNTGQETMIFSIGGHPGFALPGWPAKRYFLTFEKEEHLRPHTLQNGLIGPKMAETIPMAGQKLEVVPTLFENDALVFDDLNSAWIGIEAEDSSHRIQLHFDGFPWMGLWAKPGAPFVCIEPWYGHADKTGPMGDLSQKAATLQLQPAENFHCRYGIELVSYQ